MAQRNENNPAEAWADFAASGSVTDYLRYRTAQNRADAVTGISAVGGNHAKRGTDPARAKQQGKRPPDHGAY